MPDAPANLRHPASSVTRIPQWVCGLPASLENSIFGASGTPGISSETLIARASGRSARSTEAAEILAGGPMTPDRQWPILNVMMVKEVMRRASALDESATLSDVIGGIERTGCETLPLVQPSNGSGGGRPLVGGPD